MKVEERKRLEEDKEEDKEEEKKRKGGLKASGLSIVKYGGRRRTGRNDKREVLPI